MSDRPDRPQDDWIARLGAAISDADASTRPTAISNDVSDDATSAWALPTWPWALSGAGLCLALLALDPGTRDVPSSRQSMPPAPQVQGWSSGLSQPVEWPKDVPAAGYNGIEMAAPMFEPEPGATPQQIFAPMQTLPPADDAPAPSMPEATAIRPEPAEPEAVPVSARKSSPPPPPDFLPPEPTWGLAPLDKLPPIVGAAAAEPEPLLPQAAIPAAAKRTPRVAAPNEEAAPRARQNAPRPIRSVRSNVRPTQQPEPEYIERPAWTDKVFGPRRS